MKVRNKPTVLPSPVDVDAAPSQQIGAPALAPAVAPALEAADRVFEVSKLPPTARRELTAHLASHGLEVGANPLTQLAAAELAAGQAVDARVSSAQMTRAIQRATLAERLTPLPQRDLFGFTALTDAKLKLTTDFIHALAKAAFDPPRVTEADLRMALKAGPGDGEIAWTRPKNNVELVASLIRQMVLHAGSLALALDEKQVEFLEGVLKSQTPDIARAMGGAGGFCANLASVLPNVDAQFYTPGPLSAELGAQFAGGVRAVGPDGRVDKLSSKTSPSGTSRVNYSLEYDGGMPITVPLPGGVKLGGSTKLSSAGASRVLLGTPSAFDPGFGDLDAAAIRNLGCGHEICFLVGPHYFTKGSPEGATAKAEKLREQLTQMKKANPKLIRHFQYVVPKQPSKEARVLAAMRGGFDSIALNTVEVGGVLERMAEAGLTPPRPPVVDDKDAAEAPGQMLAGGLALAQALDLSRVHLHGSLGDLLVMDEVEDPERQVLALLRARQLASMKCANVSGEIKSPGDVWPIAPVVTGKGLAAVHAFAEAAAAGDDKLYEQIVSRWWFQDPVSNKTVFFVPSRGIHDRTGSTVSTGDTIDATALIFGLERTSATKKHPHPRALWT